MDISFEKTFYITVNAMKANNSHPAIAKDMKWLLKFILFHGIFTIGGVTFLSNIILYDLKANDFPKSCQNGILSIVYGMVTLQYGVMLWHRDKLKKIIEIMQRDYDSAKNLCSDDQNIILKYAKKAELVTKEWCIIGLGGYSLFQLKSIALSIYFSITEEFRIVPFYEVTYPDVIERNKANVFVFIFTYSLMFFYAIYAAVQYIAFVPLGPIFMLHACGQLEMVKDRIERVFERRSCREVQEELIVIVEKMQFIYSFIEDVKTSFRLVYEVTLKASAIMIPITVYAMIESIHKGGISLEFLTFVVGSVLICSSPCYYSDLLKEKMFQQSYALFNVINAIWN